MRIGLGGKYLVGITLGFILLGALVYGGFRLQRTTYDELSTLLARSMQLQGERGLERRGEAVATLLADALTNPVYFVDLERIGEVTRSALQQADIRYVLVYDGNGRILHDGSGDIAAFGMPMRDEFASAAVAASGTLTQSSEALVDVTQPIFLGRERLGGVRVGLSRSDTAAAIANATKELKQNADDQFEERLALQALPMLGLAILALISAFVVFRGLVRPIRELAQHARTVARGRYDVEVDSSRKDEIGELMRAFGSMSRNILRHDRDVRRLAYLDTLTGLPNRLMLREALSRAIQRGQGDGGGLALMFIDLDDFKRINDTLGHDAGDEALAHLSRRLETCLDSVREPGVARTDSIDLIARFGGDEFVILLGGPDVRDRAARLATRIFDAGREPLLAAGRDVHLNASIGITIYPDDAHDATQLLKNGDIAMYQAKVHGKNCARFFTNYMTKAAEDRLALEQDLRTAMQRGVLEVHYQPIVNLRDRRIVGAEALLRWDHPVRGVVPCAVFVSIAEDFGLIDELGMFALRRALRDAAHWPVLDGGVAPFVSVNLSARQLRHPTLVAEIAEALREFGVAPNRLHIELTESALLDDGPPTLDALNELGELGVNIWLDDFGTGFSGLSHLRRVPVDGVKIDRSFVQDLMTDRDDLALTSAIIAMASSLDIKAIAEGIESQPQLEILRNLGCDLGQGYWLGYPMAQVQLVETFSAQADVPQQSFG